MPLTVDLSVSELANTRFAVSPLSETVSGLQLLGGRWRRDSNLRWIHWAVDELAVRPLALPRSWPLIVSDRPSWPQFLVPAPAGARTTIDDDLAAMRRTTARQVRASLRRVFGADLPDAAEELAARPAAGLRAIAAELREAHDRLIAPHWPRIRAVLDADVAYRARQLAAGGAERLFADLHPALRWRDGRLTLDTWRGRQVSSAAAPGGLVLLPVVLGTPHVQVKLHTTTQTTMRYPARGAGALWSGAVWPAALAGGASQGGASQGGASQGGASQGGASRTPAARTARETRGECSPPSQPGLGCGPDATRGGCSPAPQPDPNCARRGIPGECSPPRRPGAPPASTVRLLGRHRAELLDALRSPSTTTDLARALRVSPSAVSQHLRVLRDSGLVASERSGRSVLYLTTRRGLDLLDPVPGLPSSDVQQQR